VQLRTGDGEMCQKKKKKKPLGIGQAKGAGLSDGFGRRNFFGCRVMSITLPRLENTASTCLRALRIIHQAGPGGADLRWN
jgi:hypothetical protein